MRLDRRLQSMGGGTIVAVVLALTGLVALTSRHAHVWTLPIRGGTADRPAILVGVAVLTSLGLIAAAGVATLVHSALLARRPHRPPLRATLLRALPLAMAALAVSGLLLIGRTDLRPRAEPGAGSTGVVESSDRRGVLLDIDWWSFDVRAGEGEPDADPEGAAAGDPGIPFAPLLIVVAVLTAIAGVTTWRSHTRRGHDDSGLPDETGQAAVHGALVGTIDAMLADPDPNTAIRGAYARLLEGLDACGTGRRDHEAPMEHLRRVFTVLHVRPEPVRELAELFELARFSTRPLSPSHRERALHALRDVATDLRI